MYSLDFILTQRNPAIVSITGRVLLRAILEYRYKLAYLTVPDISANERIKRSIKIYHRDLYEYERLPTELKAEPSQDRKEFVREWYKEVAESKEKELNRPISAQSIFDSIGDPECEEWPRDVRGKSVNPVHTRGYKVNSAITHGNLWAKKHYGLTHVNKSDGVTTALPGLDAEGTRVLYKVTATLLQSSFGIAVQFMHGYLPAHVMNRLGDQIGYITDS